MYFSCHAYLCTMWVDKFANKDILNVQTCCHRADNYFVYADLNLVPLLKTLLHGVLWRGLVSLKKDFGHHSHGAHYHQRCKSRYLQSQYIHDQILRRNVGINSWWWLKTPPACSTYQKSVKLVIVIERNEGDWQVSHESCISMESFQILENKHTPNRDILTEVHKCKRFRSYLVIFRIVLLQQYTVSSRGKTTTE